MAAEETAMDSATEPAEIALLGQPNVGKSTIFNTLTGLRQHLGNWPGKTVERKEGWVEIEGRPQKLVDLPGTYSLTAGSEEERIVREYLLSRQPGVVIFLADAVALERSLYLLSEVLALHPRVVVGLNRMDVAQRHGIQVDPQALSAALGVPVVPLVARNAEGIAELLTSVDRVHRDPQRCRPQPPQVRARSAEAVARVAERIQPVAPPPYKPSWLAQKLLEGDPQVRTWAETWLSPQAWQALEQELYQHEEVVLDILGARCDWVQSLVQAAVHRARAGQASWTDRIDRVATHSVGGPMLLFGLLALILGLTFQLALPLQEWLDEAVVQPAAAGAEALLSTSPAWLSGLVVDGLIMWVGTVLTFLPILAIFFTLMGVLEDSGYLARVALLLDRFMHTVGLHGKRALPLTLGLGCNVVSVVGTRIIESRRERLLTIMLAPLVPCSARLAILAMLAPIFFGDWALPVTLGLIGLNLLVLGALGLLLHRTLFRGESSTFLMELPLYQLPQLRTTAYHVYTQLKEFVRKAGTVIVIAATVIWALSTFPGPGIEGSALAQIGQWMAPVGDLMGLDWRLIAALLSSFVAKEVAISTLGILYGLGEEAQGLAQALPAMVAPASGLAFLVVAMLFIPCMATVAAIRQETGGWRWPAISVTLLLTVSGIAGILVYQLASLLLPAGAT
ncbi:MAG: ferrous iron transport protein B [Halorhodospira sp.]